MFCVFKKVRIAAISACVPKNIVHIEDETEYYGGSLKKVQRLKKAIGLNMRRVCPDGVTASDLCRQAALDLFAVTGIDRTEVDALLFLSQTPDYQMPATACILQDSLGLPHSCAAMDLSQGCSGYVYGLWIAASLVASGACRNVLLLVGDAFGPRYNRNRVVAPIFGDGGSATLLTSAKAEEKIYFELGTDGSGHECIIKPAGRARLPFSVAAEPDRVYYEDVADRAGNPWKLSQPFMDGKAVFDFTMRVVPAHLQRFMEKIGIESRDVDCLALHQANRQIVELVAEKAGFPPEAADASSFGLYGNLGCASLPVSICHRLGPTLCVSGRMVLCGFGVGLSWGSCAASMAGMRIAAVSEYAPGASNRTREELIRYWMDKFSRANGE